MFNILDYPLLVFVTTYFVLWLSMRFGATFLGRRWVLPAEIRDDFGTVLAATLTLLALIIGFTFSMATGRYDLRKHYEEEEANAIGTEYARVALLPAAEAAKARTLLVKYLDQRVLFYSTRDAQELQKMDVRTAQLQAELWELVLAPAAAQPTPPIALVIAGMNDVLNTQGYAQAALWNRIPTAAWVLMSLIAIGGTVLHGYGARNVKAERPLLLVLPVVVAVSFLLIADLDSPRAGVIRVSPQNLHALADSIRPK